MNYFFTKCGKRLLTAVLTASLLVGCFAVCGSAATVDNFGDDHEAYDERLYGDVNLDWKVDAIDYLLVKRAVLGTFSVSKLNLRQTDINRNGEIDAVDYLLIKRSVLGTIEPLGFAPMRELTAKAADALTDEELYERIDEEIAEASRYSGDTNKLNIRFQRITRETQAAEILASLGLPDDLRDKTIYVDLFWWLIDGRTFEITMRVPDELSLRETMFKLYRCAEISDPIQIGDVYAPVA